MGVRMPSSFGRQVTTRARVRNKTHTICPPASEVGRNLYSLDQLIEDSVVVVPCHPLLLPVTLKKRQNAGADA
jgi:hypothetical protein